MMNKITLLISCLCMLFLTGTFAQTQPGKIPQTKVAAHKTTVKSTVDKGSAMEVTTGSVNAIPTGSVVIWGGPGDANGEFAGGLNDWTTSGTGDDGSPANWYWDPQGDASTGAYWGTRTPINSASPGNGAAVFNSDFLDNNGTAGNFGNGPSPSPQTSELVSPTIDLTGHTNVALSFISYYRNFQSEVFVAYSNDNGVTWSDNIRLFENITVNVSTANATESLVYFPGSGGTNEFKFKFIWQGEYYFWIVDDVAIIEQPRHDLVLESFFYTPFRWGQPKGHIDTDEFVFDFRISNPGADAQTNVELKAQIIDENDVVVFEGIQVIDEIASGVTDTFQLDQTYLPAGLDPGVFRMEYSISADSADVWDRDNEAATTFAVTASTFQAETGNPNFQENQAVAGLPIWDIGNHYLTGADFMNETYVARSITFAPFDFSDAASLQGKSALAVLLEVTDNFLYSANLQFLLDPSLTLTGIANIDFTNQPQSGLVTLDLEKGDGTPGPVLLSENTDYFVLISYTQDSTGIVFNDEIDYGERQEFVAYANGNWFGRFTNSNLVPLARLEIGILSNTDEKPLPESAMNIFPNPVSDLLTANVDLDQPSKATILIADVSGRILNKKDFNSLGTSTVEFNTSKFANGVYYIRLITPEGTRTIKFVVQK